MIEHTVVVIGGGPVGLALALALHRRGIDCVVFDARSKGAAERDPRVLALSHGSRQILERLDLWRRLRPTVIQGIHVSQAGSFGRTRLSARDCGVAALGYVLGAGQIAREMEQEISAAGVPVVYDCRVENVAPGAADAIVSLGDARHARVRLAAFAEGAVNDRDAVVRDYDQQAVIATVETILPHGGLAYERFTPRGPIALLPYGDRYAVVYVSRAAEAQEVLALSDEAFRDRLQAQLGGRVRIGAVSARSLFPLGLRYRREAAGDRTVWLGNSAQTLHPVAGQGFNLALRDVWQMADTARLRAADPGAPEVLREYARARRLDRRATIGMTDFLVRIFSNDFPLLAAARGGGLLLLDLLPPLRGFLTRRMTFGARAWP